jgi:hypothetical protein
MVVHRSARRLGRLFEPTDANTTASITDLSSGHRSPNSYIAAHGDNRSKNCARHRDL